MHRGWSGRNPAGLIPVRGNPGGRNPGGRNPGGRNPGGRNPGGRNPGGRNPGGGQNQNAPVQDAFLHWGDRGNLIAQQELYFGDPAIVATDIGCRYLRSAYCFFLDKFALGEGYGGAFSDQDFLSIGGLFSMTIPTVPSPDFSDHLVDLVALGNSLLPHYRDIRGVAALFTDHLHFIITNPPAAVVVQGALVLQDRFKLLIRYHFAYAPMAVVRALFSSLAKASSYLGHQDAHQIELFLNQTWSDLGMVGYKWRHDLKQNPLFFEMLMFTNTVTKQRFLGYNDTATSLYSFGRNDDVHGPENTMLLTPVPQVQPTVPPQQAGLWIWAYNPVQLNWQWDWRPARGLWNWPNVPVDPAWRILWGNAALNLNANPPAATYKPRSLPIIAIQQQMRDPNQPGLMLAKLLGVFFAHGSSLILIQLQTATPEYIELPYNLYRTAVDSAVPV